MDNQINRKKLALQFIILMGLVSLFADIVYEGARGVSGPYMLLLGASATIVGLVSGLGEFFGYMLRLPFGYFADRRRAYWGLTILGYSLILAIPLLAFAGNWQLAAIFILIERVGKAIRSPARDAILSYSTKEVGRGLGFGIHEAVDQIGAVIGPALFGIIFIFRGSYKEGFNVMWIPAFLILFFLLVAKNKVPSPQKLERLTEDIQGKFPSVFWFYALFIFFAVCGFTNFQLISYHFKIKGIFSDATIPFLYALTMLIDALFALIIGKIYDRIGMKVFIVIPLITIFIPILSFSQRKILALGGLILWGIVMAVHETIMRAGIADLTSLSNRGFAYGIFNTVYGVSWFLGSTAMGFLYEVSILYLILFSVAMLLISVYIYLLLIRKVKPVFS
ncbi:MAG: MFS transporter [Candidatus Omnitrophica bacterium]|nr:MFS transporter [Candidatus Omnitrophota bacterium]